MIIETKDSQIFIRDDDIYCIELRDINLEHETLNQFCSATFLFKSNKAPMALDDIKRGSYIELLEWCRKQ